MSVFQNVRDNGLMTNDNHSEQLPGRRRQERRSAFEWVILARRIDHARASGTTWKEIAEAEGIPTRTAQDILKRYVREIREHEDPMSIYMSTVLLQAKAIEALCLEMETGDSSSARVGAARALTATLRDRLNLLVAAGAVPANTGATKHYPIAGEIVDGMVKIINSHADKVPDEVIDEMSAYLAAARSNHPPVLNVAR